MTIQVVNGFVCMDCADVALANKDINPAHPPGSPNADPRASSTGASTGSETGDGAPAISFGGSLSQLSGASAVQQPGGATQPQLNPDQTNRTQTGQAPAAQPYDPRLDPKLNISV
jgi:hypothetical protein